MTLKQVRTCQVQDDTGKVCSKPMSSREYRQDGMCDKCASLLWNNFVHPLSNNKPVKPILF